MFTEKMKVKYTYGIQAFEKVIEVYNVADPWLYEMDPQWTTDPILGCYIIGSSDHRFGFYSLEGALFDTGRLATIAI